MLDKIISVFDVNNNLKIELLKLIQLMMGTALFAK